MAITLPYLSSLFAAPLYHFSLRRSFVLVLSSPQERNYATEEAPRSLRPSGSHRSVNPPFPQFLFFVFVAKSNGFELELQICSRVGEMFEFEFEVLRSSFRGFSLQAWVGVEDSLNFDDPWRT